MMNKAKFQGIAIEVICFLYIILFVYAAVSKLSEFQNFQIQVAQSPLLTAYAGFISISVIVLEFVTAILLSIRNTRLLGLFASFTLMLLFTFYIFIILNYSPFVPCSCGGILESMGWHEHLIFNIVFDVLAIIGIYLCVESKHGKFYIPVRLAAILSFSLMLMVAIFLTSEDIVQHRNNFVRRFPPFPAQRTESKDLKYNSYYLAGESEGKIYLGNIASPAVITELDSALNVTRTLQINIKDTLFHFRNVRLRVVPPYFFLYDGTVPCIFKGTLAEKRAVLQSQAIPSFTKAEIVDPSTFIVRALSNNHEHLLSLITLNDSSARKDSPELLQKQIDGIFDTDGMLQYNRELKRFLYLYYYRNEYVVADENLKLLYRGNTIDTTTRAKVKIEFVKDRKQRTFAAPPFLVNRICALKRNLLFVNSALPGKYDSMEMWDNANVIDVYDITTKSYLMSFYVYRVDGKKIADILVSDTHLYAMIGNNVVSYRLNKVLLDKLKN